MFKDMKQVQAFFEQRQKFGIRPGLDRIKGLLKLLDHPEQKVQMLHIAGTNGKGSTIEYINEALISNDYDVGVFTSPSLDGLTGHIYLNNEKIKEETFIHLMNELYPYVKQLDELNNHPTEFEIITALSFLYFSIYVDVALIETGMGGLEDTTNCFQPILSIITSIDKDHTSFLGSTIRDIARHKAGIIKQAVPVIVGDLNEEAMKKINEVVKEKQALLYHLHDEFTYENRKKIGDKQLFTWKYEDIVSDIEIQMNGQHQVDNCSLALMALHLLRKYGFKLNVDSIVESLGRVKLQGRFEIISENPYIILDGAHNPAGVDSFLQTVKHMEQLENKELIFAAFKDKDLEYMLPKIATVFSSIKLTTFDHPRAASLTKLSDSLQETVAIEPDWRSAIDQIIQEKEENKAYFVTGSLHFIALVRSYILQLA